MVLFTLMTILLYDICWHKSKPVFCGYLKVFIHIWFSNLFIHKCTQKSVVSDQLDIQHKYDLRWHCGKNSDLLNCYQRYLCYGLCEYKKTEGILCCATFPPGSHMFLFGFSLMNSFSVLCCVISKWAGYKPVCHMLKSSNGHRIVLNECKVIACKRIPIRKCGSETM